MILSEIIIPFMIVIPYVLVCMTGNKRKVLSYILIWAGYNFISALVLLNISKDTAYGAALIGVVGLVYYAVMYKVHGVWDIHYKDRPTSAKEFKYFNLAFSICIVLMVSFSCYLGVKVWCEFNALETLVYCSVLMVILIMESIIYCLNIHKQLQDANE